jgi:serine/threonine-protein kinase
MIDPDTLQKITETNVDFAVGKHGYICHEQVRGEEEYHRGDLYSVWVLAYELLSGRLPFDRPASMDMLLAHATELPPSFEELGLSEFVPPPIEAVVMRCLEKNAADRPQTARELAAAYESALADVDVASSSFEERTTDTPLPDRAPDKPFEARFAAAADDPEALLLSFKAWMPEKIAQIKLRGYCHDFHGEVVESQPGLIRVRLPGRKRSEQTNGPLSWLGLSRKSNHTFLELRLIQHEPERENLLTVEARFRPDETSSLGDKRWRARCVNHFINLRGYLMGQVEAE